MTKQAYGTLKENLERLVNASPLSAIVFGDFMLDHYVWGNCNRISPESPVPIVHVQSENDSLGGAGNVIANLCGLGVSVYPVGVLGCDSAAHQIRKYLTNMGCPIDGLVEVFDRPTVQKTRIIAHNQQVVRIDREITRPLENAVYEQLWTHLEKALQGASVCVISDYAKGICQPGILRRIIDWAQMNNLPVIVDPKSADFTRYAGASCITPNLLETSRVVSLEHQSNEEILCAATKLQTTYQFENVLITRGADGMTLLTPETHKHIPADAREVYDVSGAGDTVIATLAASIASGLAYENAARLANTAAGIVVSKVGTVPISLAELQHAIHSNGINRTHAKISSNGDLTHRLAAWRNEDKKIVFTNGCFDILHLGHVSLLEEAANLGDVLIVGLNSDTSVRRLKGNTRPVNSESHRAFVLAGLQAVDMVVIFEEDTPIELIQNICPDILVKGGDYRKEEVVGRDFVESYGGELVLIPLLEGYSTTGLIRKIAEPSQV